jgi:nitrite reductase (cytochrome c-552)
MSSLREIVEKRPWVGWFLFLLTALLAILAGLLNTSISERRAEALFQDQKKVEVPPFEPRNAVWGLNYPREYETYRSTADTSFLSKYNGSAMIDMLEQYPALVVLWAGYGFSRDYNQSRGHYYAVTDVYNTLRTGAPTGPDDGPQPSTCWTCKSPDVPRLMHEEGVTEFYMGKWARLGSEVVNPIGCADCHDEKTMNLQISRPALVEAFQRMGRDINQATHQEMRSLVCAQCHVEYYFNPKVAEGAAYLTFPWDKGMTVEAMEEYYDNINFSDWKHALSRAPMIKAQHPDYEVYLTGIHARRGVSCADCHMPYTSQGGVKFTDHKIQSPLNNIANSCQVCHRESEDHLRQNVYDNMDRVIENRSILEHLLARTHVEAKYAWDLGATEEQMAAALRDIRHAQWRWDYAAASHGAAFHAPVETLRIIGSGIAIAQEARLKIRAVLADLGHSGEVPMPDISTKDKAQAYIGLDMEQLDRDKARFKSELLPEWLQQAREREGKMPQFEGLEGRVKPVGLK